MRRVNQAVYKKLEALLPKRVKVYPGIAEETAKLPFVIYNMDSFITSYDKDSDTRRTSYTIEVWSDKFDECDELSDIIDEGLRGNIGIGIYSLISNGSMGYNDKAGFFSRLNFDIDIDE